MLLNYILILLFIFGVSMYMLNERAQEGKSFGNRIGGTQAYEPTSTGDSACDSNQILAGLPQCAKKSPTGSRPGVVLTTEPALGAGRDIYPISSWTYPATDPTPKAEASIWEERQETIVSVTRATAVKLVSIVEYENVIVFNITTPAGADSSPATIYSWSIPITEKAVYINEKPAENPEPLM